MWSAMSLFIVSLDLPEPSYHKYDVAALSDAPKEGFVDQKEIVNFKL